MSRYEELVKLCWGIRPDHILEIGTWNGLRAEQFAQCGCTYTGFDLFEDATAETDEKEKNVKAHHTLEDVAHRLQEKGVEAYLFRGNTNETLPKYNAEHHAHFDFAFIDGGHSVETIQNDWDNVKQLMAPGGVVVFDDYYEGDIDTEEFGCNKVVENLDYYLSVSADKVKGGGLVRLAVVAL